MSLLTDAQIEEILDEYDDPDNYSLYHKLKLQPEEVQQEFWSKLSDSEIISLMYDIEFMGSVKQQVPHKSYRNTLFNCGRGFGKSWTGGSIVNYWASKYPGCTIAIVGETEKDLLEQMIPNIFDRCHPAIRAKLKYHGSRHTITWPNGSKLFSYKGNEPKQLRGPNVDFCWVDELAKYRHQDEVLSQISMVMRGNEDKNPAGYKQLVVTTTPQVTPTMLRLRDDPSWNKVQGTSFENGHISREDKRQMLRAQGKTRRGREELFAEFVEDNPDALFKMSDIDDQRVAVKSIGIEEFDRIVVAIDPSWSNKKHSDLCGIVVCGVIGNHGYVLEDASLKADMKEWTNVAIKMYYKWNANFILYESNSAGVTVPNFVAEVDPTVPTQPVLASKSKQVRADPVAHLYLHGRVSHVGYHEELEEQMVTWNPRTTPKSPDRMDALVHCLTELCLYDQNQIWVL